MGYMEAQSPGTARQAQLWPTALGLSVAMEGGHSSQVRFTGLFLPPWSRMSEKTLDGNIQLYIGFFLGAPCLEQLLRPRGHWPASRTPVKVVSISKYYCHPPH